jgi:hypothetical protein
MWVVVTLAKSKESARTIESMLSSEGILVKVKPLYKNVSEDENYYEIHVLESEAEEAREILVDKGL